MRLAATDPQFPPPYPHVPPEVPPPWRPEQPAVQPPIPTAWLPAGDDLRAQVYDRLLARRTVFVDRRLDREAASLAAAQLMTLDADEAGDDATPVTLVVNSGGGPLEAVGAVLDTIDLMRCPVHTTCLGQAHGTAAVLVAAGRGRRRAAASAQFRLRFPDLELSGDARRLGDELSHVRRLHESLVDRLAAVTHQERRLVQRDIERGRTLSADEALDYGLIDEVIRGAGSGS